MSTPQRKLISSFIRTQHDPANNIEAYCEEGLSPLFYLDISQEINDISFFLQKEGHTVERPDIEPVPVSRKLSNLFEDLACYGIIALNKRKRLVKHRIEEIGIMALSDILYQQKYGEIHDMNSLGQPTDLEIGYLTWLMSEKKYSVGKVVSSEERSLFTAKQLLDKGRTRHLKQLSYIGGLGHYDQIAYFLENPCYDFSILRDYAEKNLTIS
jgi:hypothetical protein